MTTAPRTESFTGGTSPTAASGTISFWEAGLGEDGLRLCGELVPDYVLLDYQLPDLDGLEFLDRFPAAIAGATVPIIMLTGHGNEAVAVEAMKKGVYDYLTKGLNLEGLGLVVQAAIDEGALRRQLEAQRQELERLSAERLGLVAELKQQTDGFIGYKPAARVDFLAMLAHGLRNPLAPLAHYASGHATPGSARTSGDLAEATP